MTLVYRDPTSAMTPTLGQLEVVACAVLNATIPPEMAMRLILRTHPDDSTLLEVMLEDEQGRENRVARAPLTNPRAWEWTTPPTWLRRESVEQLLDHGNDVLECHRFLCSIPNALEVKQYYLAEVEVEGPCLPGVKALQKGQETALATMRDSLTLCTVGPTGIIE